MVNYQGKKVPNLTWSHMTYISGSEAKQSILGQRAILMHVLMRGGSVSFAQTTLSLERGHFGDICISSRVTHTAIPDA
jgi:hypothetical protein